MSDPKNAPDHLWQTKLAARLHDPAEKALVLLRDPAGHEGGTTRVLRRLLGLDKLKYEAHEIIEGEGDDALVRTVFAKGVSATVYRHVQRADWWAAAGDRPQWPMTELDVTKKDGSELIIKIAPGSQVRWTKAPTLIHPLSGEESTLQPLNDTEIDDIKDRTFDHISALLKAAGFDASQTPDWKKLLLTLWRFAPEVSEELDNGTIGELWKLLPADTRVPDHSIWDHLDLTSAFAGAFAADSPEETDPNKKNAALLSLAIGPVQSFIAAARSTSDLWAGSHLLSRLAWETMRPICEALGPDAILFPRLRGIPQVDIWLKSQGVPEALFKSADWIRGGTDANPLFSASLPNRMVAIVPADQVQSLAKACSDSVRDWLQSLGKDVVARLLNEAGVTDTPEVPAYAQMHEQLNGFPEVHWAAVPFSLIQPKDEAKQRDLDTNELQSAMAPFFGCAPNIASGFLASDAWKVLRADVAWDDRTTFFSPNPGVLYPAVYDLAERLLAAAKSVRPFAQRGDEGWRCTLTGEAEWLTTDRGQLRLTAGQRSETLWAKIAAKKPSWAKEGEHLGALAAIKRLWPTVFAEQVAKATAQQSIGRFVVSTHTMALAKQMEAALLNDTFTPPSNLSEKTESVALPRKLMRNGFDDARLDALKRLPGLLDTARDAKVDSERKVADAERTIKAALGLTEGQRIETYYALLMLDGDHMGQILSGRTDGDDPHAITYLASLHPQVRKGADAHGDRNPSVEKYLNQKRAVSPNRHLAISGALNDFSQTVVRHIVEREFLGRVIYAGGDDVLAMLPVDELLPCMTRLRQAYSGHDPACKAESVSALARNTLFLQNGFALLNGRLMRMMGKTANASCGGIIAHHQTPLSMVLRELRASEKRAKTEGGRNAFSIKVLKRSGGELSVTDKWARLPLLERMREFLTRDGVSRRAVYHTLEWLRDLPELTTGTAQMVASLLAYQLKRQSKKADARDAEALALVLVSAAVGELNGGKIWLSNLLSTAEFLARETRGAMARSLPFDGDDDGADPGATVTPPNAMAAQTRRRELNN